MSRKDVVTWLIERVIADAGGLTTEQAQAIEMEARTLFGGKEQYIAAPWRRTGGRRTHPASRAAYDQALTSAPTSDIVSEHGISRATIYRLIKRGPAD